MTLYVVPTPIGNLEDITLRALKALKNARAVYCEDTRRTRILMTHYELRAPCLRYDDHNLREVERIVDRLKAGEDLALVSDSGTPVISDPGLRLVSRAREEGIVVYALPGACAAPTAVAASGLPGDSFLFLGFLPRSEGKRRKALEAAAAVGKTVVIYEAPPRVLSLLDAASAAFGPNARVAAARELTKMHEEWRLGTIDAVRADLASKEPRGEYVLVFHPGKDTKHDQDD
ncbi:MAG: 16S rRNA (cytidine(1402)-2'-O)-methyltransferase [Elusimicrobia bacterium]|nr:16S rRNA (cytidine(1402)-2'-O)-methyltransferase [Elusimicrobiota bacterium]